MRDASTAASPMQALRRIVAASASLLMTRAEFASLELGRARAQALRWFVRGLFAMIVLLVALLLTTALLVALLWYWIGPWAIAPFAALYAAVGGGLLWSLFREIDAAPSPLAETLQQLSEDRVALFGAFERADEAAPQGDSGT